MADFTINSLANTQLAGTDAFIKSDTNGAYTKTTYSDLKSRILNEIAPVVKKEVVIASGNPLVTFTNGVGTITVDLSDWADNADKYTILGQFNVYAGSKGVLATISNDNLATYTFTLYTVDPTYNGTMTVRYRITAKVLNY